MTKGYTTIALPPELEPYQQMQFSPITKKAFFENLMTLEKILIVFTKPCEQYI